MTMTSSETPAGAAAQETIRIGLILPRVEKLNGALWNVELALPLFFFFFFF